MKKISKKVEKWFVSFSDSTYFKKLTEEQEYESDLIISSFGDLMYSYHLLSPEEWDEDGYLEDCCENILPRKITAGKSFFRSVAPVLSAFFTFIEEEGMLKNSSALEKRVKKIHKKIIKNAANPKHWGMAKSLLMAAKKGGVDIEDEDELNRFFASLNKGSWPG